jgi:drug/metabolite transporter (DMT)-like permease
MEGIRKDVEAQSLLEPTEGTAQLLPRKTTSATDVAPVAMVTVPLESNMDSTPTSGPIELYHHFKSGFETWFDKFTLSVALGVWYGSGILSIVTAKVLIQDWSCPPLLLTVQQMILATMMLKIVLAARDGQVAPWPWEMHRRPRPLSPFVDDVLEGIKYYMPWIYHLNFTLTGVFHSLDFLFSNFAFSFSAPHFVETIKASDPITTTIIALIWKVDRLSLMEGGSLALLVAGVLLSTWGNASSSRPQEQERKLMESITTASFSIMANLCFGFRAMNQKKYRSITNEAQQMDDVNLLLRMVQIGSVFLFFPAFWLHMDDIVDGLGHSSDVQFGYIGLAVVNAFCYVSVK